MLREGLPPALHRAIAQSTGRAVRFDGRFKDWSGASAASTGYAHGEILDRVIRASREVEAGRAAFERDAVLFDIWQAPVQLLAPLLRHAARCGGHLEVVDFGGSLGSSYRQCRPFLPALASLRWYVIEQPGFVAAGRAEFENETLSFHDTVDALPPAAAPRLLLASSVLQYLEAPLEAIAGWDVPSVRAVLIDRTPVWSGATHWPCVQHVPRHIYPASYPCWVLSQPRLLERLAQRWRLVYEFDSVEGRHAARGGPTFDFKGFYLEDRET